MILIFTLCATYVGIRLGTCWDITAAAADAALESQTMTTILLEAEEEEDDVGRRSESVPVRDPYPLIAETAGAMVGPRTANFLRKSTIRELGFFL